AVMLLDDALGDGQAQSGSGSLAGEERLEDQRQVVPADPRTVVADLYDGGFTAGQCGDPDTAARRKRLNRIANDVEERLLDLFRIEPEQGNLPAHQKDRDTAS